MPKDTTKHKTKPRPRLVHSDETKGKTESYTFRNLPHRYNNAALFAMLIAGDSLERGGIPRGYMVAIATDQSVSNGDLAAITKTGELSETANAVGYVFFGPGGWLRLQSADRAEFGDQIYAPGEFQIMGPVVHAEPDTPWSPALKASGVNDA